MPADGFYEWTGAKTARQPLWFHRPDDGLILFAGLYESWQPEPDVWEPTYTIITTDANGTVGQVHDRMPVILPTKRTLRALANCLDGQTSYEELVRAVPGEAAPVRRGAGPGGHRPRKARAKHR